MTGMLDCKLGDVIKFGNGKVRPSNEGEVPIYGGNGILGFGADANYIEETIVIGRVGAYCGATYYENRSIWVSDNDLNQHAQGSSHPLITQTLLNSIDVEIVENPSEQKTIASVLGSLDDKIDLLHRQNQTLEALAETLFRQWFIEEAQEDWEEGRIEDLFVLQRGFDLPTQDRTVGLHPIYAASGYSGGHVEYRVRGPGVTTGRSGLLGKVFFVLEDFWPLNTSLYVKEFKLGTPLFTYFFLKTLDLNSFNAGSAVPTLNRNHVHAETALLPPRVLIEEFEKMAFPLYKKIKKNEVQIKDLEKLRDTLLPKLMSGEVRVALSA
jgi:type I restriction enzyme, S subunit